MTKIGDNQPSNQSGTETPGVVTKIRARNAACDCPHCGAEQDGWGVDPRGKETVCDQCNKPYSIAPDAAVQVN